MLLFQFLLSVAVAATLLADGFSASGLSEADLSASRLSEADILKTVFYGSEDALRGTLEDIELGSEAEVEDAQAALEASTWPGGQDYPRDRRMDLICGNLAEAPSSATVKTMGEKLRRIESPELRQSVMQSLHVKKAEMRDCCSKSSSERYECMNGARRNRYDRVCAGETACPWALLKGRHPDVSNIVNHCCASEGVARYRCFLTSRLDMKCYRRPRRSRA